MMARTSSFRDVLNTAAVLLWIIASEMLSSNTVRSRSLPVKRTAGEVDSLAYLTDFGYLEKAKLETGALRSKEELQFAIKQFQKMANLAQTGEIDSATREKMQAPRCGMKDTNNSLSGPQEFQLGPSKWPKTDISYRIDSYTYDIPKAETYHSIVNAFDVWSKVSPLRFREVSGDADIVISFTARYHDDGYAFDGPGGVLAHAFPPGDGRGGDAHFDEDERWTYRSQDGTNLFTVAAHEFGHSLGIYHSNVQGALMYPWYQGYDPKAATTLLHDDDTRAIQTLYGGKPSPGRTPSPDTPRPQPGTTPPSRPRPPTPKPTTKDTPPNPCTTDMDAISVVRGEVFAFKGPWFWRMDRNGVIDGYPVQIPRFWEGFPADVDSIDAVYERREDGKVIFFKENRYWEFNGRHLDAGFPKYGKYLTSLGMPPSVTNVDAAMVWGLNKRTYIFSGYNYWRIDTTGFKVENGYPRATDMWTGIPVPFDAAFTHLDGNTYFFKGSQYWAFNDKIMYAEKGYPKPIGEIWLKSGQCTRELISSADEVTSSWRTFILLSLSTLLFRLTC